MQIHSHHHCHSSRVNHIPVLRLHYSHLKETSFAFWCSSRKWQQRINHSRNIGALTVIKFIYLHPIKFLNRVTKLKENKTLSLHVFIQPTSTCFYISLFTVWLYVHVFKKLDTYHITYVLTGSTQSQQGQYQYSLQQGYHSNSLQLLKLLHLPTLKIIFVLNYSIWTIQKIKK